MYKNVLLKAEIFVLVIDVSQMSRTMFEDERMRNNE